MTQHRRTVTQHAAVPGMTGTTRIVTICGQRLRINVRAGDGGRTPLVMCCGIGTSFEIFDRMTNALDPGTEIIRVDMPGVGGSPVRAWPYGFPELARLVTTLLDELGHRHVDVLGFSWGGALAQQLAWQYPGRCRRVVLISTNTGLLSIPGAPDALAGMVTPQRFRTLTEQVDRWYGGDVVDDAEDLRQTFRRTQVGGSGLGYLYQLAALSSWSSPAFLRGVRQPALVMAGLHDRIVPVVNARMLADLLPRATRHLYPGGHIDPLVKPTVFAPIIDRFLALDATSAPAEREFRR